jgi:hypothetical protein
MQIGFFVAQVREHDAVACASDHAQRCAFGTAIGNGPNNKNGADAQPHQGCQAEKQKVRSDSARQSNLKVPDEHTESIPRRPGAGAGSKK